MAFVVSLNLHRRHLSESQRAMVAAKIADMRQGERTDLTPIGGMSQDDAAELLNVGTRSVQRARQVLTDGAPELVTAVEQGKVAVSTAADVAEFSHEEQQEIVARGEKEIITAAKEIRTRKREAKRTKIKERLEEIAAREVAQPTGLYDVIVVDPPWPMKKIERDERPNQSEFDYPTMTEEELTELSLPSTSQVANTAAQHELPTELSP